MLIEEIKKLSNEEIYNLTRFLPENFSIKLRKGALYLDFKTHPNFCKVCGKEYHKISAFCSQSCALSKKGMLISNEKNKQTNLKKYGVENPSQSELIKEKKKKTTLKHFGVEHNSQSPIIKEKKKQTCIREYGCEYSLQSQQIIDMRKHTNLEKYGVENPFANEEIKNKIKHTNLERYGDEYPNRCSIVRKKTKQTNLERYGAENPFANKEIKDKIKIANLKKFGVEHNSQSEVIKEQKKQTSLKHFGTRHPIQCPDIKNKIKQTNLEKYGTEYPWQSENIKNKIIKTNLEKYKTKNPMQSQEISDKAKFSNFKRYYTNRILNLKIVSPLFRIEDYRGSQQKHSWKCKTCDNIFEDYIQDGKIPRCLKCFPILTGTSYVERDLQDWLEQYILIERNKRYFENGKYKYELDILVPSKNMGIEFDGTYTHSQINGCKLPNYHLEKSEYFLNKDIQVIHIFENEWIQKQPIVKSIILSKLGLSSTKIPARKCEIKEISHKDSEKFLNENHIQGSINSQIRLGLYFNNEFIALATFGKPRYNKKFECELLRYCNKLNANVIGGFSKLLSYFLKTNPKSLITYCDRRYSIGNTYLKNGFELIGVSGPNYFYTKDHFNLESRIKYQKHKLSKILPIFDAKLTEWENMQINGFDRIWDCGNLVFELK